MPHNSNPMETPLPCIHCGQGPELPGGYICAACAVNDASDHHPLWALLKTGLGMSSSFEPYDCLSCGRALARLKGIGEFTTTSPSATTCPACRLRSGELPLTPSCRWCGGKPHPMSECPVWSGETTLTAANLQQWRDDRIRQSLTELEYHYLVTTSEPPHTDRLGPRT